jgi:hypothetical protein
MTDICAILDKINDQPAPRMVGGHPVGHWWETYQIARMHSMMWIIFTPLLWFFVYAATSLAINHRPHWGVAIFVVLSTFTALANLIGIHAVWLCKRNRIDYTKNWSEAFGPPSLSYQKHDAQRCACGHQHP